MTKSMGALLIGAALTGFVAGSSPVTKASGGNAIDPSGEAGVPAGRVKSHRHRKDKHN